MSDHPMVQALHAAISRRRWDEVEAAANKIRDDRAIHWPEMGGSNHVQNWKPRWECKARKSHTAFSPAECNWPFCGCDPYADKVMDALQESGIPLSNGTREGAT